MEDERASYRQILRSTSIVGGATAGSIVIGLLRIKIFTLLIGPAGIGLFGVFNAILMTGSMFAGLGIATSGVTELAAANDRGGDAATRVRSAIWSLTWVLAVAGGILLWVARHPVARFAAGGEQHASAVGWLGLAVCLSVIAASQSAVLQGYRRIGELGKTKLYGALVAAVLGVGAVYASPRYGLVAALIATPLAAIGVAWIYSRRLPQWRWRSMVERSSFTSEWSALIGVGFGVMLWTLTSSVTQIAVRAMIVREGGLEAAGLFQASWMISANYQVLILAAMSADYLPRLSGTAGERGAAQGTVNQQLQISLLLAAPLLVAMSAAAPVVLTILYSSQFTQAARLLQWQFAGDALKIAGWSLGFVLLARKNMALFLLAEAVYTLAYLGSIGLLLPTIGIEAAGIAHLAGYALYTAFVALMCWRKHGIMLSPANARLIAGTVAALVAVSAVAAWSREGAFLLGATFASIMAFVALRQISRMSGAVSGPFRALAVRLGLR